MNVGARLDIVKPSFWKPLLQCVSPAGETVFVFRTRNPVTYTHAEIQIPYGQTYHLSYEGWSSRRSALLDEGRVIGTMHRTGWCSKAAQLILYEKEYVWRIDAWGTRFTIEHTDGTVILEIVGCGGFGTSGSVVCHYDSADQEAFLLIAMGLYQMRLFEVEVSASTALGASIVAALV